MLQNFKLTAIVKQGKQMSLRHLPLHQQLQTQLAEEWDEMLSVFQDDEVEPVQYDPAYNIDEHERFTIEEFEVPEWLAEETSQTVADLESLALNDELLEQTKGLAAFARDGDGDEIVLFQHFGPSRIIRPRRSLLLANNMYSAANHRGISLASKLTGVYYPGMQTLAFESFHLMNTMLPLTEYYAEASEKDIRTMLAHEQLAPEDIEAIAVNSPQWMRKRFAMLRDSGILDEYEADDIVTYAGGFDIEIAQDDEGRIVFPANRTEARRLLKFLNEELFRGAITDTLYETNSKRQAGE